MEVFGVELEVIGFAVIWALGVVAAVVVPEVLIACGFEHGIEIWVKAFARGSVHIGVKGEETEGACISLVGNLDMGRRV